MSDIKPLSQLLIEELGKRKIENTPLPIVLSNNLNPKLSIRPYQKKVFQYLVNYFEESFDGKPRQNHQLLFHMATGSGKTLIMAGTILYLYKLGYRNFLFFVNSTNIIDKTRENFLNSISSKFLFNESTSLNDKRIKISEVENFQSSNPDDINLVFTTIQGLHMTLNNPKENSLTYDDFENTKIVLISDEAHHINSETKKGTKNLSQDELFEVISWEGTVEKIFKSNPENILLEYTATVDLQDTFLAEKYKPRLIFDYPLKEFRKDGYSKEVKVLQADLPPFNRSLLAILLSQYRRKIFEKNRISIKPVILFKSKTIAESKSFFEEFNNQLKGLTPSDISLLRSSTLDPIFIKLFNYLDLNNISYENLISEIKEDFSIDNLLSVNSKEESELKQLAVNSLEDEDNHYRAVFAVEKLNEGWDVLNLFDIVRLYDTRDAKLNKAGKTTTSEAQLIGRGARYCPFQLSVDQPRSQRKFDLDVEHEMKICEELYYHSAHNPKYIQELSMALQDIGIVPKTSIQKELLIKDSFKLTELYKVGHIFLNSRIKYDRSDIQGIDSSLINQRHKIDLPTGYTKTSSAFETSKASSTEIERKSQDYNLIDFGSTIIRKSINKISFYEFSNLKKYLPNLRSIEELITSPNYFLNIKIEVTGLASEVNNLTHDQKLYISSKILLNLSSIIASEKIEFKGTKEFFPHMLKSVFTNKTMNFTVGEGEDKQFGRSINDPIEATNLYHLNLNSKKWYVFNDCFGTSEEKLLIKFIDKKYDVLKEKYSDVYLIRNEKHFQIYNFSDGRPLEPDFVLYLIGKNDSEIIHYQVFIEPKGQHLLKADEWKEHFLTNIKDNFKIEQLFQNKKYVAWGLPFFNNELRMSEFESGFNELLNPTLEVNKK